MNRKIFITLTVLAIVYWLLFDFLRWIEFDTHGFIGAARLLFGSEGGFNIQSRLSKPLILLLPGAADHFFHIHPRYIFLLQNLVSFYLCGFLVYRIILNILKDEHTAYLGMIAYVMCQPFAVYSLFVQVDAAGWCFELLGIYLALKYFQADHPKYKHAAAAGLVAGLGCLVKESVVTSFIFLSVYILFRDFKFSEKLKYWAISLVCFIAPIIISQVIISHYFNVNMVSRVQEERASVGFVYYDLSNVKQVIRVMDVYWVLFIIGLINVLRTIKAHPQRTVFSSFLVTAVIALLLMPVYPYIVDRILFMIAPLLVVFVATGANAFKRFSLPLVIMGGVINVTMTYLVYRYNQPGILAAGFALFLLSVLFLSTRSRKKIPLN